MMSEIVRLAGPPEPSLGGLLQPPNISHELAERSCAHLTRIPLGENTVNTCNPALADVDGDGLDEIALPYNRGEQDVVALFRGDGSRVWENTDVRFYHAFYDQPEQYRGSHWHYRTPHRHLLTAVRDIDGDGALEVIVGDGPLYILDAQTGDVKRTLDLDGCVQVWDIGNLQEPGVPCIVAGVNHHEQSGSVVAVDAHGREVWRDETVGKSFEDKLLCGDLTGDGLDEVAFSMADASRFEVRDGVGKLLWAKHVPTEIGEDTHVDDMVIEPILDDGRQLATSTGGCLFDAEGNLLWSLNDQIEHGQKISYARPPAYDGPRLYLNSKTGRRAYLLSPMGEILWEYDNFSTAPERRLYLTTAGDWVDWSAPGARDIVQAELTSPGPDWDFPEGTPLTLYLTILSAEGRELAKLPYQDTFAAGFNGAMCARAAHMRSRDRQDIVVIPHHASEILIFSPM